MSVTKKFSQKVLVIPYADFTLFPKSPQIAGNNL